MLNFLKDFKGFISTDGYVAYRVYDDDKYKDITHVGCWTHARRLFIESLVGYALAKEWLEDKAMPIKLDMKNCQNIGSEAMAEKDAFIHSLMESCELNNICPLKYFTDLFWIIFDGREKEIDKVSLLPCNYSSNVKI